MRRISWLAANRIIIITCVSYASLCVHNLFIITFPWYILIILLTEKSICSSSSSSFFLHPSFFFLCTSCSRLFCLFMLWKSGCLLHVTDLFFPWDIIVHILYHLLFTHSLCLFWWRRILVIQFLWSLYNFLNFLTFSKNSILSVSALFF